MCSKYVYLLKKKKVNEKGAWVFNNVWCLGSIIYEWVSVRLWP